MHPEQSHRQYLDRQSLGRRCELQGRLVIGSSLDEVPLKRRCRDKAVFPRCFSFFFFFLAWLVTRNVSRRLERKQKQKKKKEAFDNFLATSAVCSRASDLTSAKLRVAISLNGSRFLVNAFNRCTRFARIGFWRRSPHRSGSLRRMWSTFRRVVSVLRDCSESVGVCECVRERMRASGIK